MTTQTIYVQLMEEGSAAARPVVGEILDNGLYKLLPIENYEESEEVWEFKPDAIVRCEKRQGIHGEFLLAVEQVDGRRIK